MTRPGLHNRLALVCLLVGLPALAVALLLLWRLELKTGQFWIAAAGLLFLWIAGPLLIRSRLVYRLGTITNLVADGGFPPLTLQPVNFEQLYAQRMQQMAAEQGEGGDAGDAGDEETVTAEFTTND